MVLRSWRHLMAGCAFFIGCCCASFADVFDNVPEAADYQVVYRLDLPLKGGFRDATPVPYKVANTKSVPPFDRVAYYLELVTPSGLTNWVYAGMDAFTTDAVRLGLPHNVDNPVAFQRMVSNLTVFANVPGVQTGTFDTGNIEMWSANYTALNSANVFGANDLVCDWGDSIDRSIDPGFGSFQVHNHEAFQVVFAYNGWASGSANGNANNDDVGIGNQPVGNPDWTSAANAGVYASRRLVILIRPKRFDVTFTALPRNHQMIPRDRSSNSAPVPIRGTESLGGFDAALLRVFRGGLQASADILQPLIYKNGSASFSFNQQITAELASYSFELYLKRGTSLYLSKRISDVVAGDVFLVYGQSNAEAALQQGSANGYASPWIRTFGESSDSVAITTNYLFWVQANGDGSEEIPAGVGQWPLVMARKIVDNYQIPVAVLNGARGGYSMPRLQRDDANPDELSSGPYDRLRYRAIQAGVNKAVRAVFFYQGEADEDNVAQHTKGFASLYKDWKLDYPAVERVFVTQVHVGCEVTWGDPALRDAQRRFADFYPDVRIMSANALPGHLFCHFAFSGHEQLGLHNYAQLARELYGGPDRPNIDPPNPLRVEFANSTGDRLRIVLRRSGDTLGVDPAALSDFLLGGDSVVPISSTLTTDAIELQFSRPVTSATNLAYVGHAGSAPGWATNANGVGLLTFSEPIANPFIRVSFVSPAGTASAHPGQAIMVSAQANSRSTTITRIELHVDGVLYAAADNTNVIASLWSVPQAYAHRLTAVAFDDGGNQAQRSLVVFAGLSDSPGGVSSGLSVWLRPETGLVWSGPGLVSRWQDSSGQGNDFVQSNINAQPTFIEGLFGDLPGVAFYGRQFLEAASGMSTGSYTKVVRFQLGNLYNLNSLLSGGPTSKTEHALYFNYSPYPALAEASTFAISSTAVGVDQPHVLTATYDGDTRQGILYLDGVQVGSGRALANNAEPSCELGALESSWFFLGAISEAAIYSRVLSSDERANVEKYLAAPPQFPDAGSDLRINSPELMGSGYLRFEIMTPFPGRETIIEFSRNLSDWIPLSTNVPSGNSFEFTEPIFSGARRLFRAVIRSN